MIRRLAIVYPNPSSTSETFIRAHIDHLPFEKKLLYGGWFPHYAEGDEVLAPPAGLIKRGFDKVNRFLTSTTVFDTRRKRSERALFRFLRTHRIEAVLAEYGPTGQAIAEVCQLAKIPLVVHFHGFDAYHKETLATYQRYERLFNQAASLVVVSRDMERQLKALGAPPSKIHYNPYGVDIEKFSPNPTKVTDPVFFFVGRFVNKKAPQLLILAFDKVRQIVPGAKLVLGGDGGLGGPGELYAACKHMVRAMRLSDSVFFLGPLTPHRVSETMRSALAYVQHSLTAEDGDSEGLPNAILEAGASGLPVISTRHAGIPDVIESGKNGYLVNEGDIDAMADKMIELARNPDLAGAMGTAARNVILQNFSLEKSIAALCEIINNA